MPARQEQEKTIVFHLSTAAEKVVGYSQTEAKKLHNSFLYNDHLILGLLRAAEEDEGIIAQLFSELDINRDNLWTKTVSEIRKGNSANEELKPTPLYTKVFELAAEEIKLSGESKIRPIHILIGLIRQEKNSSTPKILAQRKNYSKIIKLRELAKDKNLRKIEKETDFSQNQ